MMELDPVEVTLIKEYRKLHHGELRIKKRHGTFADAETIKKWDKTETTRPNRTAKQPAIEKIEKKG